jgi:Protein of unknown function (DUF3168)
MAGAAWALQTAIHQRLTADLPLLALLGGPNVWDHVPRGAIHPYITFGVTSERDWSTATDDGGEHIFVLHVWSRAAGRQEVDAITTAVRAALHNQSLTLIGYRLVSLRFEFSDARRDAADETYRGNIRLRAVTESIA